MAKFLQYMAKFVSWRYIMNTRYMLEERKADPLQREYFIAQASLMIEVAGKVQDARSLFRLAKSLFEIKRIMIILQCVKTTDKFTLITNVTSRACYLLFWLFDNLYILLKIFNVKVDKFGNYSPNSKFMQMLSERFWRLSRLFWLLGIIMFMIYCIKTLRKTYTDESDLKVGAIGKMTVNQLKANLEHLSRLRADYWVNMTRTVCDLGICLNHNDVPFKVLGKRMSGGFEGVLGMMSASAYTYSLLKFKQEI